MKDLTQPRLDDGDDDTMPLPYVGKSAEPLLKQEIEDCIVEFKEGN
jgi:hypothetical protein